MPTTPTFDPFDVDPPPLRPAVEPELAFESDVDVDVEEPEPEPPPQVYTVRPGVTAIVQPSKTQSPIVEGARRGSGLAAELADPARELADERPAAAASEGTATFVDAAGTLRTTATDR